MGEHPFREVVGSNPTSFFFFSMYNFFFVHFAIHIIEIIYYKEDMYMKYNVTISKDYNGEIVEIESFDNFEDAYNKAISIYLSTIDYFMLKYGISKLWKRLYDVDHIRTSIEDNEYSTVGFVGAINICIDTISN